MATEQFMRGLYEHFISLSEDRVDEIQKVMNDRRGAFDVNHQFTTSPSTTTMSFLQRMCNFRYFDPSSMVLEVQMLAILLEHKADVNLADCDGWTPLMFAVLRDKNHLLEPLLSAGADVKRTSSRTWGKYPAGSLAIDIAADLKNETALKLLSASAAPPAPPAPPLT